MLNDLGHLGVCDGNINFLITHHQRDQLPFCYLKQC